MRGPWPRLYVRICVHGATVLVTAVVVYSLCQSRCESSEGARRSGANGVRVDSQLGPPDNPQLLARLSRSYLLAMVIVSGPSNRANRNLLRNTWLRLRDDFFHVFVIGGKHLSGELKNEVTKEQLYHQDLLVLTDVEDGYERLTEKVLSSFNWISNHVDAKYVMKLDDDTFVSLNALQKELARLDSRQKSASKLYWGFMDGRAKPKTTGRWSEANWRLCDRYLPYALGGGYVLGKRLVDYIAVNSPLLKRFGSEDVSVGAWIAGLDVDYWHDVRFNTEWKSRGCFNSYLVTHKQTDADMRLMYQSLIASGYLCTKEHRERLSYEYNWNVPPSQCCVRNDSKIP